MVLKCITYFISQRKDVHYSIQRRVKAYIIPSFQDYLSENGPNHYGLFIFLVKQR